MSVNRRVLVACLPGLLCPAVQAAPKKPPQKAGLLTILDGDAFLLRGSDRLALAEGVELQQDDILQVPADSRLARIEYPDGLTLALGPGSNALVAPRLAGDRAGARIYLLAGWAKLAAPKDVQATLASPTLDYSTTGGTAVLSLLPQGTQLFTESGDVMVTIAGASARMLKAGELLGLQNAAGAKAEVGNRPTQAFVATLPRAFMDALPLRAAKFQDKTVEPRKLGPLAYADAQPWLDAEPALRRASLARWRPLAKDPEFRRGLAAGIKAHPEWEPILSPPQDRREAAAHTTKTSTP